MVLFSSDAEKLFEHDLGALNMATLNRRTERANLLRNLGPCCKALCARRDIAIRMQLLKNDKVILSVCERVNIFQSQAVQSVRRASLR